MNDYLYGSVEKFNTVRKISKTYFPLFYFASSYLKHHLFATELKKSLQLSIFANLFLTIVYLFFYFTIYFKHLTVYFRLRVDSMKAVILAGGLGTRLSEETELKPKPMVEIGGKPILWHIMKIYTAHGITDFIICLGYKGYIIKEYFANYALHMSDVTYDMQGNQIEIHHKSVEPWRVTLVDTGENSMTGGRLKRINKYLDGDDFCFTYGDGLSDIDIQKTIKLHKSCGTLATVTAVQPLGRFGAIKLNDEAQVIGFHEKPQGNGDTWINGGFFVLSPKVLDYITNDMTAWERDPMQRLAAEKQMSVYFHNGFWQPMDTLRDKRQLEEMWNLGNPPWKIWE